MEIMIPIWPESGGKTAARTRLADIRGAKVAMVDDNYDAPFTGHLEKLLRESYGASVTIFTKPLGSAPSPKWLIEQAAMSQVAVVGIGL